MNKSRSIYRNITLIFFIVYLNHGFGTSNKDLQSTTKIQHSEKDTSSCFRIGLIPYQLLSRSSGAYFNYQYKKIVIEFRPTYTYATKNLGLSYFFDIPHDRYFYQGINNSLIVSYHSSRNWNWGLLLGFRNWWYRNQWIPVEGTSTASNYSYDEKRSGTMYGPMLGFQIEKQFRRTKIDHAIFLNFSCTHFTGTATFYESKLWIFASDYPYKYNFNLNTFHVALGYKIGFKKIFKSHLNPLKEN